MDTGVIQKDEELLKLAKDQVKLVGKKQNKFVKNYQNKEDRASSSKVVVSNKQTGKEIVIIFEGEEVAQNFPPRCHEDDCLEQSRHGQGFSIIGAQKTCFKF